MCTLFNYASLFFPHTCVYVCVSALLCARVQRVPRAVRIFSFFFWWRFPYCPGSCGHGAHSWCCGCPLRLGEIKADARCHKGACLVLFNSPKLWHGAKAAPHYGKRSITGTISQWDTVGKTEAGRCKKTVPQSRSLSFLTLLDPHLQGVALCFFRILVSRWGSQTVLVVLCMHLGGSIP